MKKTALLTLLLFVTTIAFSQIEWKVVDERTGEHAFTLHITALNKKGGSAEPITLHFDNPDIVAAGPVCKGPAAACPEWTQKIMVSGPVPPSLKFSITFLKHTVTKAVQLEGALIEEGLNPKDF